MHLLPAYIICWAVIAWPSYSLLVPDLIYGNFKGKCSRELGSNYLLTSRDFKNCMVIRAIYFNLFALANR